MVVPGQFDDAPEDAPKSNTTTNKAKEEKVVPGAKQDDALTMLSMLADSKSKEKPQETSTPAAPVPATSDQSNGETQANLASNPNSGDLKGVSNSKEASNSPKEPNSEKDATVTATATATAEGSNNEAEPGKSTDDFLRSAVADIYGDQTNVATAGNLLSPKGKLPPATSAATAANPPTNTASNVNANTNGTSNPSAGAPAATATAQQQNNVPGAQSAAGSVPPPVPQYSAGAGSSPYGAVPPYHNHRMYPHPHPPPYGGHPHAGHAGAGYPPGVVPYGVPNNVNGYPPPNPNDVNVNAAPHAPPPYGYHPHAVHAHAAHHGGAVQHHAAAAAAMHGHPTAHLNHPYGVGGFAPGYGGAHGANLAHAPGYPAYGMNNDNGHATSHARSKRLPVIPPNNIYLINTSNINENDVLCGRGGLTNQHVGNKKFRALVKQLQDKYMTRKKHEKTLLSQAVVAVVRGSTPAGRFLKQDTQTGMWYDIGDEMATEKTSQAFREKSKAKPKRESSDATASVTATATVVGDSAESLEGLTVTAAAASNSDNVTAEVAAAAAAVTKEAGNEVNVMATVEEGKKDNGFVNKETDAPAVGAKRSADEAVAVAGKDGVDESNPAKRIATVTV
eukprot:CAMPEP_0196808620 /NCGR_PEP_ID=MMETSP1362-20130617/8609_1 /TAXON_ID=163516 /ORGANISM="Leptocylindrus danicus, Strain CCMP1856" /LENGTH=618 /DNA_ID=CAMNT_0042183027 /DNA_START=674 /DNA_END=2530 /DNA_ORIENTATION=+